MIDPEYCRMMARYNRWMNERLYASCGKLTEAERKRDREAFFGSIHGTLNHLLWGDRMWMGRFVGPQCTHPPFGADMFAEFADLQQDREATDQLILDWSANLRPDWLASAFTYTSVVDDRRRTLPAEVAVIHMFNHGTHHRGQLSTLMKQAGVDPGVTDLPWLPGLVPAA
jgi:uncharacterized damage-inducible protein DinB